MQMSAGSGIAHVLVAVPDDGLRTYAATSGQSAQRRVRGHGCLDGGPGGMTADHARAADRPGC